MDRRSFVSALAFAATGVLAGCSSNASKDELGSADVQSEPVQQSEESVVPNEVAGEKPFSAIAHLESLSALQINSLNIMNYLAVLSQRVISAKNNRLLLDDAYRELYNNIMPDAVDLNTLDQINFLAGTIEEFRMTDVKRERLRVVYERAQVDAARQAIPDPIALLSTVTSGNLAAFAASVIYMAVDSASSYSAALEGAESELVKGNWELDDEESKTLHLSRESLFSYIVEMVEEYDVPGFMSIMEEGAERFTSWEGKSVSQRIRYFEKECDKYCALGAYWLLLAQAYYEIKDYARCIKAVETYESFSAGIFRNDYPYAKVLALGINAAKESSKHDFAECAKRWVPAMLQNCDDADWALRYYAAQCYLSLAGETRDASYIGLAYEVALDNVNELVQVQRGLNEAYVAPLAKKDGAENFFWSDEEAKDKHRYNKLLETERKMALPPVHQPLILNLELIKAIQGAHPEYVVQEAVTDLLGEAPFLSSSLNQRYVGGDSSLDVSAVAYDCGEIKIPAALLAAGSKMTATVKIGSEKSKIADWTIDRVEREVEDDPSTYLAVCKSERAKKVKYADGTTVNLRITVLPEVDVEPIAIAFKAIGTKEKPWDQIAIWDDGFSFERA